MEGFGLALGAAFWLGLLTAVSPCPLATNIAAISYISRGVSSPRRVLFAGLFYALGRVLAYVALAALLVGGLFAVPDLAVFVQKHFNVVIGPLLVVAGMLLLELISLKLGKGIAMEGLQNKLAKAGHAGATGLGALFALAFCPVSAALFFISLIPLAVKHHSSVVVPAVYGLGTGLPVVVVAVMVALGARSIGTAFKKVTKIEWWARRVTGALFILVGIYLTLIHIYGIQL